MRSERCCAFGATLNDESKNAPPYREGNGGGSLVLFHKLTSHLMPTRIRNLCHIAAGRQLTAIDIGTPCTESHRALRELLTREGIQLQTDMR